jgi:hypothetical protein
MWGVLSGERTGRPNCFSYNLCTDRVENIVTIVADATAYTEVCLPSRCLETGRIALLFHRCSARTT